MDNEKSENAIKPYFKNESGVLFCGDCFEVMRGLPEKSVSLIIADPPYFEVKGNFDFVWSSFADYLSDVEKWAVACKRVLADNGTLFWYGHAKKIAYSQVVLDKYFNLENSLVWEKTNGQTLKGMNGFNCFAPVTERILMYSNEVLKTGLEEIKANSDLFSNLRTYARKIREYVGYSRSKMVNVLGNGCSQHFLEPDGPQWDLCTAETYKQLNHYFNISSMSGFIEYEALRSEYEALRSEYEALRSEYEALRRPFKNEFNLTDVMKFNQDSSGKYKHDTVKPEMLTTALILSCSRPGDTVYAPFAGSGTECAMAVKHGRRFIGSEISEEYCAISQARIIAASEQAKQETLFKEFKELPN